MTAKDIIKAGKAKVRNSSLLYPIYIEQFTAVFGRSPECPTCGSAQGNRDWSAFEHYANYNEIQTLTPTTIMANTNQTFVIRDKNKIYSYDYTHDNGRILRARTWGHSMTEDFAKAYLTSGTKEQLEARAAEFKTLPQDVEGTLEVDLNALTVAQLKEKLTEQGIDAKGLKKNELIELLEASTNDDENQVNVDADAKLADPVNENDLDNDGQDDLLK